MRVVPLLIVTVACSPAEHGGVQVGEESIAQPDPCTILEDFVAFDEPAIDDQSAEDLLAALVLDGVAQPTWFDDADRPLAIRLQWAGGDVRLVTSTGDAPECEAPPVLELDVTADVTTEDELIMERFTSTVGVRAASSVGASTEVALGSEGGTIDTMAALEAVYSDPLDSAWLDISVSASPEGGFNGWITAIGTTEDVAGGLVEADIAHW